MSRDSFTAAFPDRDGAIVKTFFTSSDVTEKTWASVGLLAEADDVTFWTVVANHPKLPSVMANLLASVDVAHSSPSPAQRRAVRREDEACLCRIVIRMATRSATCTGDRDVASSDLARRIDTVLPLSTLPLLATMLFRKSGAAASTVVTSLVLLNPGYLCRLQLYMSNWFDYVNRLATKCQSELQRGRYQRMSGDVIPLFEQTYRTTKNLWALLQSAPFLSDYVPLSRTLRAMRVLVDVVSPVLQHLLMTCEGLNSRRDVLSKANAMIVNTAVNASAILVLFHTFERAGGARAWTVPKVPEEVYGTLASFLEQYSNGTPQLLTSALGRGKNLHTLAHQLSPPLVDAEDAQVGRVILALFKPIADSNDLADVLRECRERFSEVLLLELVQQGLAVDSLLARRFVTTDEAKALGASEDAIVRAMAGLAVEEPEVRRTPAPAEATPTAATAGEGSQADADPLVDMVAEIFPHFNRHGIRAALNYYNNDPEQLILDASMENIPPHLKSQLTAAPAVTAAAEGEVPMETDAAMASTEPRAHHTQHLTHGDFDDNLSEADLQLYLGSDLYELLTSSDVEDGAAGPLDADGGGAPADYASYRKGGDADYGLIGSDGNSGFGTLDDDMRFKIRMLNELMYEDEMDDGQHDEMRVANVGSDSDDEGGEGTAVQHASAGAARGAGGGRRAVGEAEADGQPSKTSTGPPPPRSDYDRKQFRARVARERAQHAKEKASEREAGTPAYAKKQKAAKRQKGGGDKNALARAFRKGEL